MNLVAEKLDVLVKDTASAAPVAPWIAPPVHVATDVQVPPFPEIVSPPLDPVLLRTMPLDAPFDEMLRNVRPLAPMVVLATFNAVPVVVVSVLTMVVLFCVAATVPPPVAVKAAFTLVVSAMPPVKVIVAPVLLFRMMPVPVPPVEETAPPSVIVPPVLF